MPADMLRAVRQSVCDRIDEYRAIVEDPAFKEYFPVVGESHLKTVPKGFPKDFPYPQYIRCKDFTVACRVEDEFFPSGLYGTDYRRVSPAETLCRFYK